MNFEAKNKMGQKCQSTLQTKDSAFLLRYVIIFILREKDQISPEDR